MEFGLVPVPVDLAGTRPVPQFFIIGFMMSYLHHVPPPVPWLDHVHPSSSQTVSRTTLQFPDCITRSSPVPWMYHVLPSSSLAGSRAPLQFPDCITYYPPVPRLHHALFSSSLDVSRAPLQFPDCIKCYTRVHKMYHAPPLWRHLERKIIFIFTVCYFYLFHITDISA